MGYNYMNVVTEHQPVLDYSPQGENSWLCRFAHFLSSRLTIVGTLTPQKSFQRIIAFAVGWKPLESIAFHLRAFGIAQASWKRRLTVGRPVRPNLDMVLRAEFVKKCSIVPRASRTIESSQFDCFNFFELARSGFLNS